MCACMHIVLVVHTHVPCVCACACISILTHLNNITVKMHILIPWFCTDSAFTSTIDCMDPKRRKKHSICVHVNKFCLLLWLQSHSLWGVIHPMFTLSEMAPL